MKLYPAKFIDYLLSDEVGFTSAEPIEATKHEKEGLFLASVFMTSDFYKAKILLEWTRSKYADKL